eukprot:g11664.t1
MPPGGGRSRSWRQVKANVPASGASAGDQIPGPRSGAASVVVGNKLFMFGGYGGSGRLDDFWEFDFETRVWKEVHCQGPSPGVRENNGVVEYKGSLYLFGGYNGSQWLNDFHGFHIETRTWRKVEPAGAPPVSRFGYVAVVHSHYFCLFGGYDGTTWLNDMHRFNFDTSLWEEVHTSGEIPSIRSCPSWCKDGDNVYVFGGYDGVQRMNDFYRCDLETMTWAQIRGEGDVPTPRYFHSCAVHNGSMYVFGGYNGTDRLCDFFEHNFDTGTWTELEPHGDVPTGRSSLVAQVHGNSLFIFGGYNGQVVLNDFYEWRFQPLLVPPPTLQEDMRKLVNNRELSDVTFIVDGFPVYASRVHLALRSEHFRAMLYGGMRESEKGAEIEIKDVSHAVFLKLLEYLYTDTLSDVTPNQAVHLLVASEQYLLVRLKTLCEEAIRTSITVETVCTIFLLAHKHNAEGLKEIALDFILDNMEGVKDTAGFLELKQEPDLLMEIIFRQAC